MNLEVFLLILCFQKVILTQKLNIAGLFEDIELHKTAFFYETKIVNKETDSSSTTKIDPLIQPESQPNHAFSALRSFCSFLNESAVGIFGAQTSNNLEIVQNLSEKKEVPLILTRWVDNKPLGLLTLNFYPDPILLTQAYLDIVKALEWESLTVMYTDSRSFLKISSFIKLAEEIDITTYIAHLDPYHTGNYRPVLKNLRESGQTNFVIDCPIRHLRELLLQIQQAGMMTQNYNYFINNLDFDTQDLGPFMYNKAILTGIHLVKPREAEAIKVIRELCHFYQVTFDDNCMSRVGQDFPELDAETALIMDAVQLYISVIKNANITSGKSIKCDGNDTWEHGVEVYNMLKESSFKGITGMIEFGDNGYRNVFELVVFQIRENFVDKGFWNTSIGLNMTVDTMDILDLDSNIVNTNLLVEITLTTPFVMLKEPTENLRGNDRYEGFAIDLIDKISKMEGFKYTLVLRADGKNGAFDPQAGKWTGMIGDILERKVDMAISDLTITGDRLGPVEFTQPFMDLGVGILFHKPSEKPPSFFYFAKPISKRLWYGIGIAYLAVVFSLFIIGRLCRSDWTKKHSCESYIYNQLTLKNSFWFAAGSMFRQNTQIGIRSVSGRVLAAAWWSFCFVTVAMYIAHSMAHDTVLEKEIMFNDVQELVQKAEYYGIKFGALRGGATESFFKKSTNPILEEIGTYMVEHPEDMAISLDDGVNRTIFENYAYFMESTVIEYVTARNCELTMVGGLLDNKGYGIAVPKDSQYLTALNKAILKLQTSGDLIQLKRKWWEERRYGEDCNVRDQEEASPIDVFHIEGLLMITLLGTIIAFLCSLIEFHKHIKKICKVNKLPYGKVFCTELKRSFGAQTKRTIHVPKTTNGKESMELL